MRYSKITVRSGTPEFRSNLQGMNEQKSRCRVLPTSSGRWEGFNSSQTGKSEAVTERNRAPERGRSSRGSTLR